jgi:hypothetical protein
VIYSNLLLDEVNLYANYSVIGSFANYLIKTGAR